MKYKIFETQRLIIKPTEPKDAELIYRILNTPKYFEFVGDRKVTSVEKAKDYIQEKMLPQLKRLGFSNYTLIRKSNNVKIGVCGLYDREGIEGIDIGFALLPEFEGNGFAFESANRLKEAALNDFNIKAINAITSKENIASQNLIEKLGLELVGETKLPDDDEELLLYKINK
ncbi:MAG: GNAT family N-acetyltransferase [Ignavibacteriae bacterium]|nr:GNAT family N-acetyltransferase [Ignavibacteriota bacterium]